MMEELHPATLNCANASKIFQASYEKLQAGDLAALIHVYRLGVMSQNFEIYWAGPVQLTKLADSYAQFSDGFNFLLGP